MQIVQMSLEHVHLRCIYHCLCQAVPAVVVVVVVVVVIVVVILSDVYGIGQWLLNLTQTSSYTWLHAG